MKKKSVKNCLFVFPRGYHAFYAKKFSNLRPLLSITSPHLSEYLKSLDIGLWKVGAKKSLNGVRKCDGQTDRQTNLRTF